MKSIIINPLNNQRYLISSKQGKKILTQYINNYLSGGAQEKVTSSAPMNLSNTSTIRFPRLEFAGSFI